MKWRKKSSLYGFFNSLITSADTYKHMNHFVYRSEEENVSLLQAFEDALLKAQTAAKPFSFAVKKQVYLRHSNTL